MPDHSTRRGTGRRMTRVGRATQTDQPLSLHACSSGAHRRGELAGRHIEKRQAKAGLLGMLATAHAQRHKQS